MSNGVLVRYVVLGVLALGVVGAMVSEGTIAFFTDVERSTANTFTAGGVDLQIGSLASYNQMICSEVAGEYRWQPEPGFVPSSSHYPALDSGCDGTWVKTDLQPGVHTFFSIDDLKPGDVGSDSISLTVADNAVWGQLAIEGRVDSDGSCTSAEQIAEGGGCVEGGADGEIDDYLTIRAWLDQGTQPGFQCGDIAATSTGRSCDEDTTEGDNIYQAAEGSYFWQDIVVGDVDAFDIAEVLTGVYGEFNCSDIYGTTEYGVCHGLTADGRMVPSVPYYLGLAWEFPADTVGNDAQTDIFQADIVFTVEQYRNNPNPFADSSVQAFTTSSDTGTSTGATTTGPDTGPPATTTATSTDSMDVATTTATTTLGASVSISPASLSATTGVQVNFVASIMAEAGFDNAGLKISLDDNGAGGSFYSGTVSGSCNSSNPDPDNSFTITSNKGVCYANDLPGSYTLEVSLFDSADILINTAVVPVEVIAAQ